VTCTTGGQSRKGTLLSQPLLPFGDCAADEGHVNAEKKGP
jgi:hypothetical protein